MANGQNRRTDDDCGMMINHRQQVLEHLLAAEPARWWNIGPILPPILRGAKAIHNMKIDDLVGEFFADAQTCKLSDGSKYTYYWELHRLAGWMRDNGAPEVEQVTPDHMRDYARFLENKSKRETLKCFRSRLTAARCFFRYAVQRGLITSSPAVAQIKRPAKQQSARREPKPPRDYTKTAYAEITEYLTDCRLRDVGPRTLESYSGCLVRWMKFSAGCESDAERAQRMREFLMQAQNNRTRHQRYRTIKTFVRWQAMQERGADWVSGRIKVRLQQAPQPKVLTMSDLGKILAQMPANFTGERDKLLLQLLFCTGLRAGTAIGLRWDQISLQDREIGPFVTKGGREQTLPIPQWIADELARWRGMVTGELVFPNRCDATLPLDRHRLVARLRGYALSAGFPPERRIYLHLLRHSSATAMVEAGVDIAVVSKVLGHSTIAMTMRYAQVSQTRIRTAIDSVFGKGGCTGQ
jgi:site-specific recombinase XerD